MRRILGWLLILSLVLVPTLWAATPVVLVNSSTGSDTAASGAGPSTAISGATGRTRNTASQTHVGLFGATDDFSTVATDGSHVLYIAIATAGARNFSSISAIKNTRQTGSDAAITSGTATLVVGSTTGWTAGDVIKVATAGAASADLYSTILTVDSGIQATLNDNAGTTCAACAWENPKQPTLTTGQELNTGATNTAWAIGGKRLTIGGTNSLKLVSNNSASGDAMPGWILELESGYTETLAASYIMRRAGDTTTGRITLRGAAGGTRPILTFSNNGVAISLAGSRQTIKYLDLRNSNATKTASVGIDNANSVSNAMIHDVRVADATNKFWKGIRLAATSVEGYIIRGCEIGNTANIGIDNAALDGEVVNTWVYSAGSHGITISAAATQAHHLHGNLLVYNATDGINVTIGTSANIGRTALRIDQNTFHGNGGDGIEINSASTQLGVYDGLEFQNNLLTYNGGYALNFSGSSVTDIFLGATAAQLRNTNHYQNTSGLSNLTLTIDEGTTNIDPAGGLASATKDYAGTTSGSVFTITSAMKATGYPKGGTIAIGTASGTYSYIDVGVAQRQEPAASSCGVWFPFVDRSPANDDLDWLTHGRERAS